MSSPDSGSLRAFMPEVAGFIDACREAFGTAEVNSWIRAGLKDGTFWAEENGHTVGVKPVETGNYTTGGQWFEGSKLIEWDKRRRAAADSKGAGC